MPFPLKILHTEASVGWGGQEIRILQESLWLAREGHRVIILCAPESGIYERYADREIPNLAIRTLPLKRTLDPLDVFRIFQMIRGEGVHLVHTHSSIDSWTASVAAKFARVPIVRSRHVSIPVKNFFPRNLVYRFPDRILTSGGKIATMMAGLSTVRPDRIVSIPAGVNLERFRPDIDGAHIREEFQIPGEAFLAGKVAVLRSWKGHTDFVNAAEQLLREKRNAYFLIVGDGPGFDRIQRLIRAKNLETRILMTGYREDIPEVIRSLDVLALASTSGEATSQVIPQAWACKRCVLATTAGGIRDIVRHRENGFLVPPGDPAQMAEGLRFLMDNPQARQDLAEEGYSYVTRNLTEREMMKKTLAVYRELARGGAS